MRRRRIALSRNHGGGLRWHIELTLTTRNGFEKSTAKLSVLGDG